MSSWTDLAQWIDQNGFVVLSVGLLVLVLLLLWVLGVVLGLGRRAGNTDMLAQDVTELLDGQARLQQVWRSELSQSQMQLRS